ncbi:MAG: VWA domain-containing protein [Cryobacterium sp.]|nr:VWA domain-containing protein [Oligoflexia bacterium]
MVINKARVSEVTQPTRELNSNTHCARVRLAFVSIFLFATFGCSKVGPTLESLKAYYPSTLTEPNQINVNFCTTPASTVQSNLKYLFIIDNSTSNRTNYKLKYTLDALGNSVASPQCPIDTGTTNQYATDPTRSRRYQALQDFMTSIEADPARANDPSRYYGLIEFSTQATVRSAGGGSFVQNPTAFKNLITQRYQASSTPGSGVDDGTTDYLAALSLAKSVIQSDIQAAKNTMPAKSSAYVIVFISDGFPIPGAGLLCQNGTAIYLDQNGLQIQPQSPTQIKQMVQSIVALESETEYVDLISMFTGYMKVNGNEDPGARTLLKDMAIVGKGGAYEFGNGQSVDFNLFTLPPRMLRHELGEVFVRNMNSVWWPGEREQLLDSDADGIPDKIERQLGLNPFSRDSNGNGISDLVEYLHPTGQSCAGVVNPNGDDDGDGLTNCEETYLGNSTGIKNFDTNGNLIPDGLEFASNLDFIHSPNGDQSDFDFDGLTNRTEIKLGLPPTMDNHLFQNLVPLRYETIIRSQTDLQTCYTIKVHGIKRMTSTDLIHVDIIERSPAIFNYAKLRTKEANFSAGSDQLTIDLVLP